MFFRFLSLVFLLNASVIANVDKEVKTYFDFNNDKLLLKEVHKFKIEQLLQKSYISLEDDLYKDYIPQDINVNEHLSESHQEILKDTAYTQLALVGAIGVLWILPESISKWDKDEIRENSLSAKWKENIKAGPILDEDEFAINYIGHPVSGAIYYTMARNDGLTPFESFAFSFAMSTFFWEYGYESLAEIPSIQDLVSTPIVGAFIGEYMYYLEKELDKNGGLVWESRTLGGISYAFLDPMGRLADTLSDLVDTEVTMHYTTYQQAQYKEENRYSRTLEKPTQFSQYNYGVVINFKF